MTDVFQPSAHPEALPEFALGVLDPEERTSMLAHLSHCATCREELLELSAVADRVAAQAPPVEPQAGFEDRVLARLDGVGGLRPVTPQGLADPRVRRTSRAAVKRGDKRHFTWRQVAAVAAAASIVVGAGTAIGMAAGSTSSTNPVASGASAGGWYATLLVGPSGPVGKVFVDSDERPWMSMGISGSHLGTLRCELVSPSGKVVTLGTFAVSAQGGYWATYIPAAAHGATIVRLVDTSGKMVATATMR